MGMTLIHELQYQSTCPRSCNQAYLESGQLTEMHEGNQMTVMVAKRMWETGNCPPIRIEYDKRQGFVVVADDDIKKYTLICEYVGRVDFLCRHIRSEHDSLFDLLCTDDPKTSLVIVPA